MFLDLAEVTLKSEVTLDLFVLLIDKEGTLLLFLSCFMEETFLFSFLLEDELGEFLLFSRFLGRGSSRRQILLVNFTEL